MNWNFKHIISLSSFSRESLLYVLKVARDMEVAMPTDLLKGYILGILFFEPSTRTRLSFTAAMLRLGGEILDFGEAERTSLKKGESFKDTIRMMGAYTDVITLRHSLEGAAQLASDIAGVPIINAGDGAHQHPTQTLLDLYTIEKCHGRLDGLKIGFVGDLKYGRAVHSLLEALSLFDCEIFLVSPPQLRVSEQVLNHVRDKGIKITESDSLTESLPLMDVLYATRIQEERFADRVEYQRVRGSYRIDAALLHGCGVKDSLRIMHPLPRVGELAEDVDETPYAVYFQQARNGIPIRQALLALVLGKV